MDPSLEKEGKGQSRESQQTQGLRGEGDFLHRREQMERNVQKAVDNSEQMKDVSLKSLEIAELEHALAKENAKGAQLLLKNMELKSQIERMAQIMVGVGNCFEEQISKRPVIQIPPISTDITKRFTRMRVVRKNFNRQLDKYRRVALDLAKSLAAVTDIPLSEVPEDVAYNSQPFVDKCVRSFNAHLDQIWNEETLSRLAIKQRNEAIQKDRDRVNETLTRIGSAAFALRQQLNTNHKTLMAELNISRHLPSRTIQDEDDIQDL